MLDLQETILSTNDSLASVDTDGSLYTKELATKCAHTTLTVITNYLMLHRLSSEALHVVSGLFKRTDTLCAAGKLSCAVVYVIGSNLFCVPREIVVPTHATQQVIIR